MKKRIVNKENNTIFSSLDEKCIDCINSYCIKGYASHVCEIDHKTKRLGFYKTGAGTAYACSEDSNTTKNFKLEVESLAVGIKYLEEAKKDIVEATINDEQERVHRLIHNLKSLNAHCIQELYSIVPQHLLIRNISETLDIVQNTIETHSREAAKGFLRIAKYNTGVKAEFSIYDKLLKNDVRLSPRYHNIRDVIMLVLHMFFGDFTEKHVFVEVENYYEKAYMDFESVHVAFYHIIENSTKYVCPNTKIDVHFRLDGNTNVVIFSMRSLFLYPEDIKNIFNDGYSGVLAKQTGKAGHGLGMYRAKQLLTKNNSTIEFVPGTIPYKNDGIDYANNMIVVKIPSNDTRTK